MGEDLGRGLGFFCLEDKLGEGEGEGKGGRNFERRRILGNRLVFGNSHRDTIVAGNFGLTGQETTTIPGAMESKRLFLVG
jgi:hypothetical protein